MMTEPGNNSESEYFAGLFGQPELTRRANWDGREEPIYLMLGDCHIGGDDVQKELADLEMRFSHISGVPTHDNTIDIYHKVVN